MPPFRIPFAAMLATAALLSVGSASHALAGGCRHSDVVFYTTDSQRLAQRLAANPSPCADYYVSVTPGGADSLAPRAIAAAIRANGPQFHALAEVRTAAWASWVAANGKTWFDAGVEARRRMAAAGYDVASGDSWAVNELKADALANTGTARADLREFVRGLYTGDGTPSAGLVFVTDPMQATADLTQYKSQLQDFLGDTPFWDDMSRYVRFWGQEAYADTRLWGVDGADTASRRSYLNDYLQHAFALAEAGPGSVSAARSFLERAYTPMANAAWPKTVDSGFGDTNVDVSVMESFVAAQTDAMRASAAADRFGFAWVPKTGTGAPPAATLVELVDHLATAVHASDTDPAGACTAAACDGLVAGAAFSDAWKAFASWSPPTNTLEGAGVQVQPAAAISITFASVLSRGSTQATVLAPSPAPPAGLRLPAGAPAYDITTTAEYAGPVDVCTSYGAADYTGVTPRLYHLAGGAWSDVTTSLDRASQTVCGRVTSLSPFAVVGDEPPVVSAPGDTAVDASSPAGAAVEFGVSASDGVDPAPSVTCVPGSGSTFAIGDTLVRCTAADNVGNTATAGFVVHVRGASEQLAALGQAVDGLGPGKSLSAKVSDAEAALDLGDITAARAALAALTNELKAQTGKSIPAGIASSLTAAAERVIDVLGRTS
jgi:HYR domain-containing protein